MIYMTRQEEIVNAAKEHGNQTEFSELVNSQLSRDILSPYGIGFIEGCEWADKHPESGIMTNVNQEYFNSGFYAGKVATEAKTKIWLMRNITRYTEEEIEELLSDLDNMLNVT